MIWIVLAHIVLVVGAFGVVSMLLAVARVREVPLKDALEGAPMRERKVRPELLDSRLVPTAWLTAGLPALLCAWFLKAQGYTESALITGVVAMGLGWTNGRFLSRSPS